MPTRRRAKVVIVNQTGVDLSGITLRHKYSDNYKDPYNYGPLLSNQQTGECGVTYNTGAFTTGRDWWYLSWTGKNDTVSYTDPDNCRGFLDGLESVGQVLLPIVISIVSSVGLGAAIGPEGPALMSLIRAGTIGVGVAAFDFTLGISDYMLNSEKTEGFKQHILREEDEDKVTYIYLRRNEVEFQSPSGISRTSVTTVSAKDYVERVVNILPARPLPIGAVPTIRPIGICTLPTGMGM